MFKYFIDFEKNYSLKNDGFSEICPTLLLGTLSEVRDTHLDGDFYLGNYSSINRCKIKIGSAVGVNSYLSDTDLEKYGSIGSRVSIGGFEHPLDWLSFHSFQWNQKIEHWEISNNLRTNFESKPIPKRNFIGPDVWIGNNAVVLSGVRVETGSVVGASSVVTKNTLPYSINVGNPSRIIGYRFEQNIINQLLDLKWWDLEFAKIAMLNFKNIEVAISQIIKIRSEI
jgi:acetyltransferase-like isoleucine patch superfamily enzyme